MPTDRPLIEHLVYEADQHGYRVALVPDDIDLGEVDHAVTLTQYPALSAAGIDIASEVVEDLHARGYDLTVYPLGRGARVIAEEITDGIDYPDALAAAVAARAMSCVDAFEQDGIDLAEASTVVLIEVLEEQCGYTPSYADRVVADCLALVKQSDAGEEG